MATVLTLTVLTWVTNYTCMIRLVEPNPSRGWTIWRHQEPVYKLPMCQCFQMAKPTTLAHLRLSDPTDSKTALCLDTSDLAWAILGGQVTRLEASNVSLLSNGQSNDTDTIVRTD